MPVSTQWFIANRVALVTFTGAFTIEERMEDFDLSEGASTTEPIFVIIDERNMTWQPGIASFRKLLSKPLPQNLCTFISIGKRNLAQQFAAEAASKLFGHNIEFFDNITAALDYLFSQAPDLQHSPTEVELRS